MEKNTERIKELIDNLITPGHIEKTNNLPKARVMYGSPGEELMPKEPVYLSNYCDKYKELISERTKYSSNKEFYNAIAKQFASEYIPTLISEFNITDQKLLDRLNRIKSGESIKIFASKEEVDEWLSAKTNGEKTSLGGDYGAFKYEEYICFVPDYNSKGIVSVEESIEKGCTMLSQMIHETIHLIIDIEVEERFTMDGMSKLTSGGHLLNEGLVEMYSLDIAKKYGYIHAPAPSYMNYVELNRLLKEYHGEEKFNTLARSGTYEQIIPEEFLKDYKINERIKYFADIEYKTQKQNIDTMENPSM